MVWKTIGSLLSNAENSKLVELIAVGQCCYHRNDVSLKGNIISINGEGRSKSLTFSYRHSETKLPIQLTKPFRECVVDIPCEFLTPSPPKLLTKVCSEGYTTVPTREDRQRLKAVRKAFQVEQTKALFSKHSEQKKKEETDKALLGKFESNTAESGSGEVDNGAAIAEGEVQAQADSKAVLSEEVQSLTRSEISEAKEDEAQSVTRSETTEAEEDVQSATGYETTESERDDQKSEVEVQKKIKESINVHNKKKKKLEKLQQNRLLTIKLMRELKSPSDILHGSGEDDFLYPFRVEHYRQIYEGLVACKRFDEAQVKLDATQSSYALNPSPQKAIALLLGFTVTSLPLTADCGHRTRDFFRAAHLAQIEKVAIRTISKDIGSDPRSHLQANFNSDSLTDEMEKVFIERFHGSVRFLWLDYLNMPYSWFKMNVKPSFISNLSRMVDCGFCKEGFYAEMPFFPDLKEWIDGNSEVNNQFEYTEISIGDVATYSSLYKATEEAGDALKELEGPYCNENTFRDQIAHKWPALIRLTLKPGMRPPCKGQGVGIEPQSLIGDTTSQFGLGHHSSDDEDEDSMCEKISSPTSRPQEEAIDLTGPSPLAEPKTVRKDGVLAASTVIQNRIREKFHSEMKKEDNPWIASNQFFHFILGWGTDEETALDSDEFENLFRIQSLDSNQLNRRVRKDTLKTLLDMVNVELYPTFSNSDGSNLAYGGVFKDASPDDMKEVVEGVEPKKKRIRIMFEKAETEESTDDNNVLPMDISLENGIDNAAERCPPNCYGNCSCTPCTFKNGYFIPDLTQEALSRKDRMTEAGFPTSVGTNVVVVNGEGYAGVHRDINSTSAHPNYWVRLESAQVVWQSEGVISAQAISGTSNRKSFQMLTGHGYRYNDTETLCILILLIRLHGGNPAVVCISYEPDVSDQWIFKYHEGDAFKTLLSQLKPEYNFVMKEEDVEMFTRKFLDVGRLEFPNCPEPMQTKPSEESLEVIRRLKSEAQSTLAIGGSKVGKDLSKIVTTENVHFVSKNMNKTFVINEKCFALNSKVSFSSSVGMTKTFKVLNRPVEDYDFSAKIVSKNSIEEPDVDMTVDPVGGVNENDRDIEFAKHHRLSQGSKKEAPVQPATQPQSDDIAGVGRQKRNMSQRAELEGLECGAQKKEPSRSGVAEKKSRGNKDSKQVESKEDKEKVKALSKEFASLKATTEKNEKDLQKQLEKAKVAAEKAKTEAEKAKSEAEKAKSEAEKAKSEAEKAKSEAELAKKIASDEKTKRMSSENSRSNAQFLQPPQSTRGLLQSLPLDQLPQQVAKGKSRGRKNHIIGTVQNQNHIQLAPQEQFAHFPSQEEKEIQPASQPQEILLVQQQEGQVQNQDPVLLTERQQFRGQIPLVQHQQVHNQGQILLVQQQEGQVQNQEPVLLTERQQFRGQMPLVQHQQVHNQGQILLVQQQEEQVQNQEQVLFEQQLRQLQVLHHQLQVAFTQQEQTQQKKVQCSQQHQQDQVQTLSKGQVQFAQQQQQDHSHSQGQVQFAQQQQQDRSHSQGQFQFVQQQEQDQSNTSQGQVQFAQQQQQDRSHSQGQVQFAQQQQQDRSHSQGQVQFAQQQQQDRSHSSQGQDHSHSEGQVQFVQQQQQDQSNSQGQVQFAHQQQIPLPQQYQQGQVQGKVYSSQQNQVTHQVQQIPFDQQQCQNEPCQQLQQGQNRQWQQPQRCQNESWQQSHQGQNGHWHQPQQCNNGRWQQSQQGHSGHWQQSQQCNIGSWQQPQQVQNGPWQQLQQGNSGPWQQSQQDQNGSWQQFQQNGSWQQSQQRNCELQGQNVPLQPSQQGNLGPRQSTFYRRQRRQFKKTFDLRRIQHSLDMNAMNLGGALVSRGTALHGYTNALNANLMMPSQLNEVVPNHCSDFDEIDDDGF